MPPASTISRCFGHGLAEPAGAHPAITYDHPDYAVWLNNLAGLLREHGFGMRRRSRFTGNLLRCLKPVWGRSIQTRKMARENLEIFLKEKAAASE